MEIRKSTLEDIINFLVDFIQCNSIYEASLKKMRAVFTTYRLMYKEMSDETAEKVLHSIYLNIMDDRDRVLISEDDFVFTMMEDI